MRRTLVSLGVLAFLATSAASVHAQDRAAARSLFDEGRKLTDAKDFAAACPKFKASLEIDPKLGTKLALAACYEAIGRSASAWAEFRDAVAMAKTARDKRERYAQEHADKLEPKLVKLAINVENPPDGLVVKRDGETVLAASFGSAVPVDPGEYAVEASAPGYEPWSEKVTVGTDPVTNVTVPALVKVATPPPPKDTGPAIPMPVAEHHTPTQVYLGWAAGGAGVVMAGVGTVFAVGASSDWSDAKKHCNSASPRVCDPQGVSLHDDASSKATLSTIFITAGAVAIGAGVFLLLTTPSGSDAAAAPPEKQAWRLVPAIAPGAATLTFSGSL